MKIRMTTNSIRIRIRKSELKTLSESGSITDSINFNRDKVFVYGLTISDSAAKITARFNADTMVIDIPQAQAQAWATTDTVGLERTIEQEDGQMLHLLVEKDFPCLDRPEEDHDDTFHELAEKKDANC